MSFPELEIEIEASGYLPKNHASHDRWTHWKIILIRFFDPYDELHPYQIKVKAVLFPARKIRKKFTTGQKAQIEYTFNISDIRIHSKMLKMHTRIAEDKPETLKKAKDELKNAINLFAIETELNQFKDKPLDINHLERCIHSCLLKD